MELLAQDPVLLEQIADDLLLAPIDPSSHGEHEQVQPECVHGGKGKCRRRLGQQPRPIRGEQCLFWAG
jgi:hypothetical protein